MKNDLVNSQNIQLNTRNLSQINFKQKIPKTVNGVITDKTLAIASSAATAMGLATITISKNNNEVKKFDHDKLAIEIKKKNHKVDCFVTADVPPVYADKYDIERVVLNILSNRFLTLSLISLVLTGSIF